MIQLKVLNAEGGEVGQVGFPRSVLGGIVRRRVLRDAVVAYEANRRVGSHDVLERDEVHCSGAKMYRQKGTGRARHRDRAVNLWRGGYVAHGPHPRDYRQAFPRKARRAAIRSALLAKFLDGEVLVVDALHFEEPKTKRFAEILRGLGLAGTSVLVATASRDENLIKSGRNVAGVTLADVRDLDALQLLRHRRLLLTRGALDALVAREKAWRTKGRGGGR